MLSDWWTQNNITSWLVRAKLELREECSEQDALDVVEIMKSCMVDTVSDNIGIMDFSRYINTNHWLVGTVLILSSDRLVHNNSIFWLVVRSHMGSGMSSRGAAKKFIQILNRHSEIQQKNLFTLDEMKTICTMANISVSGSFADFIASLNNQGFLIKKSTKLYQLLSSDYWVQHIQSTHIYQ